MPAAVGRGDERVTRLREPQPGHLHDLVAVHGVGQRLSHRRVQELAVLRLVRVRVDDECLHRDARRGRDHHPSGLERSDGRGGRVLADHVQVSPLERGDHGVGVGEELQAEAIDVRLLAPPVRIPLEERDLVLGVLLQHERSPRDDGGGILEGLELCPLPRRVFRPYVLGQDRERLELGQHVGDLVSGRVDSRVGERCFIEDDRRSLRLLPRAVFK